MKTVLVVYDSRSGHTARIARRIWETIIAEGHQADMMHVLEADREGVDWNKYDLVICGAPVLYGVFRKQFLAFVNRWKAVLDAKPNSFFNVTVIARNPAKATPEGNVYCRKFLENNPVAPEGRQVLRRQSRLPELELDRRQAHPDDHEDDQGPDGNDGRHRLHRLGSR